MRDLGAPKNGKFDVVLLTFGGNDVGFADVLADCYRLKVSGESWKNFVRDPIEPADDCDVTENELIERIEALAEGDRFEIDSGGPGGFGTVVTGSLTDFYLTVARRHLRPRGQLVVLGYPQLFADSGEWPAWELTRCHGVTRGDANMIRRVSERLDRAISKHAASADEQVPGRSISFLSVHDLFENDGESHNLCGRGADWMNGFTLADRVKQSFHPRRAGHEGIAQFVENCITKGDAAICGDTAQQMEKQTYALDGAMPHAYPACWGMLSLCLGDQLFDAAVLFGKADTQSKRSSTGETVSGWRLGSEVELQVGAIGDQITSLTVSAVQSNAKINLPASLNRRTDRPATLGQMSLEDAEAIFAPMEPNVVLRQVDDRANVEYQWHLIPEAFVGVTFSTEMGSGVPTSAQLRAAPVTRIGIIDTGGGRDRYFDDDTSQLLTWHDLANRSYETRWSGTVRLTSGRWERAGEVVYANEAMHVVRDLDLDGDLDAVVLLQENGGGMTSRFAELIVLVSSDQHLRQITSLALPDGAMVHELAWSDGGIEVALAELGPDDANCCPSIRATRRWTASDILGN